MNLNEMIQAVKDRVDDDQNNEVIIQWLNEGINEMAIRAKANFPQFIMTGDISGQVPPFPEKYHHLPVIYACAKFKEYDSSTQEADQFNRQFNQQVIGFTSNYEVPAYYRDDRLSQQFTAVEGQDTFEITKEGYNRRFGDLKVYRNAKREMNFSLGNGNEFFLASPCAEGDRVTAVWEEHADMLEPPHTWWSW